MKKLARYHLTDRLGNKSMLDVFDNDNAVVMRLQTGKGIPEAESNLQGTVRVPAFWGRTPDESEAVCAAIERFIESGARDLEETEYHPDLQDTLAEAHQRRETREGR